MRLIKRDIETPLISPQVTLFLNTYLPNEVADLRSPGLPSEVAGLRGLGLLSEVAGPRDLGFPLPTTSGVALLKS